MDNLIDNNPNPLNPNPQPQVNPQVVPMGDNNQPIVPFNAPANQLLTGHVEIQRLKGPNWTTWKWQLQNLLDSRGLTYVLTSTAASVPLNDPREVAVRQILSGSLDQSLITKVIHCASAQQIWECLRSIFENRTSFALTDLIGKMNSYKMNSLEDVENGVSAIQNMAAQIRTLGGSADDATVESAILRALPRNFESFITSWTFLDQERRTLDNLQAHLMRTVFIIRQHDASDQSKALSAHLHRARGPSKAKDPSNNDSKSPAKNKSILFCRYCKKPGHTKEECRKLAKKKEAEAKPSGDSSNTISPTKTVQETSPQDGPSCNRVAYGHIATSSSKPVCLSVGSNSAFIQTNWVADSGASFHMTSHRDWIAGYTELSTPIVVRLGDNREVQVKGKGFIETQIGVIDPVFYLPDISENLFSVSSCAREYGIFSTNTDKHIIFTRENEELFRGNLNNHGIYELNFSIKLAKNVAMLATSLQDWHHILAHVSPSTIKYMAKHKTVDGLVISDDLCKPCETCAAGKCQKASHRPKTTLKSSLPGQVMHFDTVGPMPVPSLGDSLYYVLCKDECTSYKLVFFTKLKSEIPDLVKKIISRVKLETGNDVLKIVTDQGNEFVNSNLKSFLTERGILHQTSAIYTPEQNGLIEREIRTIAQASRTLRLKAKLPKEFWAEAVDTSVYTLNRVINSRNKTQTPFELWFRDHKKPNLNNLHRFGELAIVLTPKRVRDKLDPKGERLIFTGYTELFNTFRFIDPDSNELIVSCNATFMGEMYTNSPNHKHYHLSDDDVAIISTSNFQIYDPLIDKYPEESIATSYSKNNTTFSIEESNDHITARNSNLDHDASISSFERTFYDEQPAEEDILNATFDIDDDRESPALMQPEQPDQERLATLRQRINKPNYTGWKLYLSALATSDDPAGFKEAMTRDDHRQWRIAMDEELESLRKCGVFSLVDRPQHKNVVSNRWVLRIKRNPDGKLERYRARLVARGFSQIEGIDYSNTYAPTASMSSIRMLFAHAAAKQLLTAQFDIKTAFLYGDLDEEVYLEQPDGFVVNKNKVWRLHKSLYGLKQAPRQWSHKFTQFLLKIDLQQSKEDRCVFYRHQPLAIIVIYVDDGVIFAHEQSIIDDLISQLEQRFEMRSMPLSSFLGFQIERTSADHILLHQSSYISKLVKRYTEDLSTLKPHRSPISPSKDHITSGTPLPKSKPYNQLVGSLLYAATCTRVDIAFPVGKAGRALKSPTENDWALLERIVGYLNATPDFGLSYRADRQEGLITYCDADFAADEKTARSTTGFVILYAGAPIHWRSVLQDMVTTSSTESEIVSLESAVKQSITIYNFAVEIGIISPQPIKLLCDNQSAIKLATSERSSQRTRHLRAKFGFLQELSEKQVIDIKHVRSEMQLADMLTKPLSVQGFVSARNQLLSCFKSKALFVAMMAVSATVVSNHQFNIVKPILYQELDKIVNVGEVEYEIDYTPRNPCDQLKPFLPKSDISKPVFDPVQHHEFPTPPGVVAHPTTESSNSIHIDRMVEKDYVMTYLTECEYVHDAWNSKIEELISRSPHLRHNFSIHDVYKRSLTDAIFGGVVSNLIRTIYEEYAPWSDHNHLEKTMQVQSIISARVDRFEASFNASTAIQKGVIDMVRGNARSIRELNRQMGIFKQFSQKLTWLSSYIQSRILFASADMRSIIETMSHGRVATMELSELFNLTEIRDIDPADTQFISVTRIQPNTLRFKFLVRKGSPDTRVYKLFAFRYWDNLTYTPVMLDYQGVNYVLLNSSSNCIKGLEDITERVVYEECDTRNYFSPSIREWRRYHPNKMDDENLTAVKRTQHGNYIYCFPYKIILNGTSHRCPTMPFKLSLSTAFTVGNHSYELHHRRVKIAHVDKPFIDQVSVNHFDNFSVASSDAVFFDRIQYLANENLKLTKELHFSREVVKHGVTWYATVGLYITVTAILVTLMVKIFLMSQQLKTQGKKMAGDVTELKNYDVTNCSNCRKSDARLELPRPPSPRTNSPLPAAPPQPNARL